MAKSTAKKTADKFPINKLIPHCRKLFGVSSTTFVGATQGMTGEYTVEEVKNAINEWYKKEVK